MIANALGFVPEPTSTSPNVNQPTFQNPPPVANPSYTIAIAPSASAVIINGITSVLSSATPIPTNPPMTSPPMVLINSKSLPVNAATPLVIAGQTIYPGAPPLTIHGTPVSLAAGPTSGIIISSSTLPLPAGTTPPIIQLGSQSYTATAGPPQYIIGDTTIMPGGPPGSSSGIPIQIPAGASEILVGSSTIPLVTGPEATGRNGGLLPPVVIGSQTFTANSASEYIIGSQILTPGAPAVVITGLGEVSALLTAGSGTNVPEPTASSITQIEIPITIGSQIFTPNPSTFSIDGTTLTAGGPGVMIQKTLVSLEPSGSGVVVGSRTISISMGIPSIGASAIDTSNGAKQTGGVSYTTVGSTLVENAGVSGSSTGVGVASQTAEGGADALRRSGWVGSVKQKTRLGASFKCLMGITWAMVMA